VPVQQQCGRNLRGEAVGGDELQAVARRDASRQGDQRNRAIVHPAPERAVGRHGDRSPVVALERLFGVPCGDAMAQVDFQFRGAG